MATREEAARRRGKIRAKRVYAQQVAEGFAATRRADRHIAARRSIGISLAVLAGLVAFAHLLDHQNAFHIMSRQALEDVLVGYPTAMALLTIAAIVAWPRASH
jgi:hypothetical protein